MLLSDFLRHKNKIAIISNIPFRQRMFSLYRIYSGVKLLYSTCIFLTYFVQFYVPMLIIQPPILKHVPEEYQAWADYGIRAATVILTCKYESNAREVM